MGQLNQPATIAQRLAVLSSVRNIEAALRTECARLPRGLRGQPTEMAGSGLRDLQRELAHALRFLATPGQPEGRP